MSERVRKLSYRVCCAVALIFSVVILFDLKLKGDLNTEIILLLSALIVLLGWGVCEWKRHSDLIKKQSNVIKTYKMYIQPLEELTKEIRARQHEFDNHLNAVLNMHITIDNYDELVETQSQYIKDMYIEDSRQLIALLKISDKILAGFLYSKIVAAPKYLDVNLQVRDFEIISTVPEHDIIEIIGTLVDNAYEASTEEMNHIEMILDSEDNKIYFEVRNQVKDMNFSKMSMFFKKGYSTKGSKRGLGLHNAKRIANKYGGDLTVELMELYDKDYISFKVEL
jgi:sensor histidine kinase regulating citrate/malate metabolism